MEIPKGVSKEYLHALTMKMTLKAFNYGTRPTNYKILTMLPSTIALIQDELKIKNVSANKHVNELESAGLVTRERGTGKAEKTELSINLLKLIEQIQREALQKLEEQMKDE